MVTRHAVLVRCNHSEAASKLRFSQYPIFSFVVEDLPGRISQTVFMLTTKVPFFCGLRKIGRPSRLNFPKQFFHCALKTFSTASTKFFAHPTTSLCLTAIHKNQKNLNRSLYKSRTVYILFFICVHIGK